MFQQIQAGNSTSPWRALRNPDRNVEATEAVAALIESDSPCQRSMPLADRVFGPTFFPLVLASLERGDIQRPRRLEMPIRRQAT